MNDDKPNYRLIDIKVLIWREVIANPDYSLEQLQDALRQAKMKMSTVTAATLAAEFRRILKS